MDGELEIADEGGEEMSWDMMRGARRMRT